MEIQFNDSMEADKQDRVCSILAALCLMADTKKHMGKFSGNTRWLYQHELEHQYKWALYNTLRLLEILTQSDIGSSTNVERICTGGHKAFEELIDEYAGCFETKSDQD